MTYVDEFLDSKGISAEAMMPASEVDEDTLPEHIDTVLTGIADTFDGEHAVNGMEGYTLTDAQQYLAGVMQANGMIRWNRHGTESMLDTVKAGLVKAWQYVKGLIASLWNYFFKGKKIEDVVQNADTEVKRAREVKYPSVSNPDAIKKFGTTVAPKIKSIIDGVTKNDNAMLNDVKSLKPLAGKPAVDGDHMHTTFQMIRLNPSLVEDLNVTDLPDNQQHAAASFLNAVEKVIKKLKDAAANCKKEAELCQKFIDERLVKLEKPELSDADKEMLSVAIAWNKAEIKWLSANIKSIIELIGKCGVLAKDTATQLK